MRPPAPGGESATLSRELADFLVELSISLHKNAIYPDGHPLLGTAVVALQRRLVPLLRERGTLALGVARHQLVIEGVATNPTNPLLRELAGRLHRHHLGAVRFQAGVTESELADFLLTVGMDAGRTGRPLGNETAEALARWQNIRLFPMTFAQLELLDERDTGDEDDEDARDDGLTPLALRRRGGAASASDGNRAAQLWIGLARAALVHEDTAAELPPSTDPVVVAQAIDEHERDLAYDQVVVGYLLQIAQELRAREGRDAAQLRRRISRLVAAMKPETLRRLLEMGGDLAQRKRFVLDATAGMAVDAVVELVEAAAESSHQTVSHSMMRLLSKFAAHAEGGAAAVRQEADGALRDHVRQLMSEWNLEDPNPDAYRRTLEGMSRAPSVFATVEHAYPPEPERIVQMSLEVGAVGEALWRAVDAMAARDDVAPLLDLLDDAPAGWTREAILDRVATPERLRHLLALDPPPLRTVERLVGAMGLAAAHPLLDAIEGAEERHVPALVSIARLLGAEVLPVLGMHLEQAGWSAQQRLLAVVGALDAVPAEFSALPWLKHDDAGVRREAVRVGVRIPAERDAVLEVAVLDADESVVGAALAAALHGCPQQALGTIVRRVNDGGYSPALRALAVAVVAEHGDAATGDWLVSRACERRGLLRRLRLRPPSPETAAAVDALARRWRGHRDAAAVLALAARSDDPELRRAATGRRASAAMRALPQPNAATTDGGGA